MSCTLSKRSYESIDGNGPNTPPREAPFLGAAFAPAASGFYQSPQRSVNHMNNNENYLNSPTKRIRAGNWAPSSPQTYDFFKSENIDASSLEDMEKYLPRRKRTKAREDDKDDMAATIHTSQRQPSQKEVTFTLEQVKAIVAKALQEREEQLREEYNLILKEKLSEQFENFSKFNQDCISRQMKESQHDYML